MVIILANTYIIKYGFINKKFIEKVCHILECNVIVTWSQHVTLRPFFTFNWTFNIPTCSVNPRKLSLILQYNDVSGSLQISPQSRLWWWLAMETTYHKATLKAIGLFEAFILLIWGRASIKTMKQDIWLAGCNKCGFMVIKR